MTSCSTSLLSAALMQRNRARHACMQVEAGAEPSMFTCNFLGWVDGATAAYVDPYEAKLALLRAERDVAVPTSLPKRAYALWPRNCVVLRVAVVAFEAVCACFSPFVRPEQRVHIRFEHWWWWWWR